MTCLRPQKVSSAAGYGPNKVIDYKLNRLYMLGIQACGGGKKEATRVAAFLGIGSNCLGHQFSQMEQELGKITSEFGKECMALNLQKELALSQRDETTGMIALKVCGDACWRKRAVGMKCDSISGLHEFIGLHSKKVLAVKIMSRQCLYCDSNTPHEEGACPKNHDGSAKSMEAEGCLANVLSLHKPGEHYVGLIVQDHDSSTQAVCRYSYQENLDVNKVPWPRQPSGGKMKDYGCLPLEHPEIIFKGDKNHAIKNVSKLAFAAAKAKGKADTKPTSNHARRFKKNLGYAVKKNSDPAQGSLQQFKDAVNNVVEHNFGNHVNCGAWCEVKRLMDAGGSQEEIQELQKAKKYPLKAEHEKAYQKMKAISDARLTMEWCDDLYHPYSSQLSEAIHKAITSVLPKDRCYSKTMVESVRVYLIVAISSRGWEEAYINLLERMELEMSVALRGHLKQKDRDVKRQREYQSSPEAKRKRAKLNNDKMKEECNKTKKDRRRGRTYKDTGDDDDVECDDGLETFMKIGQAVNQEVNTDNRVPTAKRTAKRKAPDQLICKSCGERGHGNRRSKKCRMFGKCHRSFTGSYLQSTYVKI